MSTNAAKTTRFSTALECALFNRAAQGARGFGSSGYPTASARPRTPIMFKVYGIQSTAVRAAVRDRYKSSGVIISSHRTDSVRLRLLAREGNASSTPQPAGVACVMPIRRFHVSRMRHEGTLSPPAELQTSAPAHVHSTPPRRRRCRWRCNCWRSGPSRPWQPEHWCLYPVGSEHRHDILQERVQLLFQDNVIDINPDASGILTTVQEVDIHKFRQCSLSSPVALLDP